MIIHKTPIRVRYADTDKMEFVYNGKYLEYFEVGRTELLRHFGLPYSSLEAEGYQLPLIEAGLKFIEPGRYDDILEIEASVKTLKSAKIHIDYNIYRQSTGKIITTGFTEHMFINKDSKKPVKPPKLYTETLSKHFVQNER